MISPSRCKKIVKGSAKLLSQTSLAITATIWNNRTTTLALQALQVRNMTLVTGQQLLPRLPVSQLSQSMELVSSNAVFSPSIGIFSSQCHFLGSGLFLDFTSLFPTLHHIQPVPLTPNLLLKALLSLDPEYLPVGTKPSPLLSCKTIRKLCSLAAQFPGLSLQGSI